MTDDPRVSETYRETATERAPEHLNKAVLQAAAEAARPRYSLLRSWTRPVAWAAVVMLSFAMVLELTQTPTISNEELRAPASVAEPSKEQRIDSLRSEYEALAESESDDLAKRERSESGFQQLRASDTDMLQRAEGIARMQQGPSDAPPPAAAEPVAADAFTADADLAEEVVMPLPEKNAMRSAAGFIDMEAGCEESARVEAESWLACIKALEESGLTQVAEAERQLLRAAFPDFTEE